jgi:hypothetical protein
VDATLNKGQKAIASNCNVDLSQLRRIVGIGNVVIPRHDRFFAFKQLVNALDLSLKFLMGRQVVQAGIPRLCPVLNRSQLAIKCGRNEILLRRGESTPRMRQWINVKRSV